MISLLSLLLFLQSNDYYFRELEAYFIDLQDYYKDSASINRLYYESIDKSYYESPEYVGKLVQLKKIDAKSYLVTEKDFFRVILDSISTNLIGDSCFIQMKVIEQGEGVTYETYIKIKNLKYQVDSNFSKLKFLKRHKKLLSS